MSCVKYLQVPHQVPLRGEAVQGAFRFAPAGLHFTSTCFTGASNGKLPYRKEVRRGQIQEAEGPVPNS